MLYAQPFFKNRQVPRVRVRFHRVGEGSRDIGDGGDEALRDSARDYYQTYPSACIAVYDDYPVFSSPSLAV